VRSLYSHPLSIDPTKDGKFLLYYVASFPPRLLKYCKPNFFLPDHPKQGGARRREPNEFENFKPNRLNARMT
jgi:hypothetical protein